MNLMNLMDYHHFPIYSIMVLFLGAFVVAACGTKPSKNLKNPAGARAWIALLATALSLFFLICLVKPVMLGGEIIAYWMGNRAIAGGYAIGIALEVDALSLFFGLLIATAVFVSCLYSIRYMVHDDCVPQYYTLYCMLAGGVLGLVLSGDIFNMFVMVEILTFAAVALTAFRTKVYGALEAAFKYLVVGCMGSTAILAGVIMLYAQYHTLNLAQLATLIPGTMNNATKLAFAFLYIGFSTKAFIVPFHPLAADAHGAAPASISVLISGVLTKSGIYGIIRITYFLFQTMGLGTMQFMLVFIGSVSMFVCVTMALAQHDFKRLLAYHSISQIGYVLAAVGLASGLGFSAGLYHAMNHTLFKGLLFLAAGAVLHETGTTDLGKLGGLSKKMPHTTVLFLVGAFSISGVPPFNGFASKWMIYQATYQRAVETGNIGFLAVTIVALITYAVRVLRTAPRGVRERQGGPLRHASGHGHPGRAVHRHRPVPAPRHHLPDRARRQRHPERGQLHPLHGLQERADPPARRLHPGRRLGARQLAADPLHRAAGRDHRRGGVQVRQRPTCSPRSAAETSSGASSTTGDTTSASCMSCTAASSTTTRCGRWSRWPSPSAS